MTQPEGRFGAPAPFDSTPTTPKSGGGCGKALLIGCGVLIVLLGVGGILLVWKAQDILLWTFESLQAQVLAKLPEDFTEEDRERLVQAFQGATETMATGEVDPEELQAVQSRLMEIVRKPRESLTREDLVELTEALERMAGIPPPESPESRTD